MNYYKRSKRKTARNRLSVEINKRMIKETILESYREIEEQRKKKHLPSEFLKLPLSLIFFILKSILAILSIVFLIVPFVSIRSYGLSFAYLLLTVISLSITVICGLFAYVCHRTGNDVEKETDKYYIVNYFSAIVSFVALIIALIGLYKTF